MNVNDLVSQLQDVTAERDQLAEELQQARTKLRQTAIERESLARDVANLKREIADLEAPFSHVRIQSARAAMLAVADLIEVAYRPRAMISRESLCELVRQQAGIFPSGNPT